MTVLKLGHLSVTAIGGGNGTVSSNGLEVTVVTFGIHCIFSTTNTSIGTITGGNPAVLGISASIPRTDGGGGAFCGTTPQPLTGSYQITQPKPLSIS